MPEIKYGDAAILTNYGTITTDTATSEVKCRGYVTLSAHLTTGSGTWTWQFKGPDGTWRSIIGGSDFITEQVYTTTNMINVFYGGEVQVRADATSGSSPSWSWQIIGDQDNR